MSNRYSATPFLSDEETAKTALLDGDAGNVGSNFTSGPERAWWFSRAERKLLELCALAEDWDSYGAARPDIRSAEALWDILNAFANAIPDSDCPELFASPSGGFTAEWTSAHGEFSIETEPGETPTAWLKPVDGDSEFLEFSEIYPEPMLTYARRFFI